MLTWIFCLLKFALGEIIPNAKRRLEEIFSVNDFKLYSSMRFTNTVLQE